MESNRGVRWIWYAALAALAIMMFFVCLGEPGMYAPQEGRAGIIVRNMTDSGDYLTMQFKGHDTSEKPICFYWLCLASSKIFGFNEFAFRFPSALASCLGVLLAYLLGRRIYCERTGLVAGMILATCLAYVNFGRIARIDIVLGVAYAWTMYFLYRGYFEEMKANWRLYVFYVMLGFCVLLKGPVSVALAGFGVVLFALIQRNWRIFWELKPISGFIIGAITTFPWFLHEYYRTGGQSTANFFISHNIERFLGYNSPYGGGKRKPFLFYVPNLLAGAMPWTILLPGCVWKLWDAWRNFETGKELRARLLDLHKIFRPQTWFLLTWFAAVLVFFSFSAYKRPDYLMPLYPAMAILLGRLLVGIDEASLKLPKGWRCLLGFVLGLAVAFVVAVKSGLAAAVTRPCLSDKIPFVSERDARTALEFFAIMNANILAFSVLLLVAASLLIVCWGLLERAKILSGAVLLACVAFASHMGFDIFVAPRIDALKTLRVEAKAYEAAIPKDAFITYFNVENAEELIYYIPRDYEEYSSVDRLATAAAPYLVMKEYCYEKELSPSRKPLYEVVARTAPGHQYPTVFCKLKEAPPPK